MNKNGIFTAWNHNRNLVKRMQATLTKEQCKPGTTISVVVGNVNASFNVNFNEQNNVKQCGHAIPMLTNNNVHKNESMGKSLVNMMPSYQEQCE